MGTIVQAANQWATRPHDERFGSVSELHATTYNEYERSTTRRITLPAIRVSPSSEGKGAKSLAFKIGDQEFLPTSFAFEQLCRLVGCPPGYLQSLPSGLASDNLRYGIYKNSAERPDDDKPYSVLLTSIGDGQTQMRAITSVDYENARIWDHEAVKVAGDLNGAWRLPPARPTDYNSPTIRRATEKDVLDMGGFGLSVNIGDLIDNAGAYRGDRDFFLFLVNPERNFDDGAGNQISRAIMLWGSEVGARSIGFRACAFKHVCGNHILWDAKDVLHIRKVHRGANVRSVFDEIKTFIDVYSDGDTSTEQVKIAAARAKMVANTKEEVIERVGRITYSNKKLATEAFTLSEKYYDVHRSNPGSFWGMVEGLTYRSQQEPNADKRVAIDGVASKLLAMV